MVELIIGVVSSIVGGVAVIFFQYIHCYLAERTSPLTDVWIGTTYDSAGNVRTKDRLMLRQRDENLRGEIERLLPERHKHRKWRWTGKMRDKNLFAIFWCKSKNIPSYGTVFMRQKSDHEFTGYYLTFHEQVNHDGSSIGGMERIPVTMIREKDAQPEHGHVRSK